MYIYNSIAKYNVNQDRKALKSGVLHSIYKIVKKLIIKNGLDCAVSDLRKALWYTVKNSLKIF
jgi:hypothetical protein